MVSVYMIDAKIRLRPLYAVLLVYIPIVSGLHDHLKPGPENIQFAY